MSLAEVVRQVGAAYFFVHYICAMLRTRQDREKLRRAFQPASVRLLFVGESPPASGRFFYSRNSGLYLAMREAFRRVAPEIDDQSFLEMFKSSGCYLIDLCLEPIDNMDLKAREGARLASEGSLARAIRKLQPPAIAILLRSITANVSRAAFRTGWQGQIIHLPYPGRWHQHRRLFIETLAPTLYQLISMAESCNSKNEFPVSRP
jgi:hypothetical protein